MKDKPVLRQSNFELLRIVAMLMIIAHHFAYYNVYVTAYICNTANGIWLQMMRVGGKVGVSVFVMISGYFMVKSSGFKLSKLIKFWMQVLFYSVLGYLTASLVQGHFDFSFETIKKTLMPLTYDRWWFASAYVVLLILSPFLNKMLHALSRNAYLGMLFAMLILWYVVPTFLLQTLRQTELTWFLFLYCLAGYIRLHGMKLFKRTGSYWIATAIAAAANLLLRVLFIRWGINNQEISNYASDFTDLNKLPILIVSVLLFLSFLHLRVKPSKGINTVASVAFGVYLIHEDPFIRQWLIDNIYMRVNVLSAGLIPYTIAAVVGIYIVAGLFEFLRINLIENRYMRGIRKLDKKWDSFIRCRFSRLGEKLSENND